MEGAFCQADSCWNRHSQPNNEDFEAKGSKTMFHILYLSANNTLPYQLLIPILIQWYFAKLQNEEALAEGGANGASQSLYKDADKCCKVISGKLSSGGCIKTIATTAALLAAGAAAVSANPNAIAYVKNLVESLDLNKITETVMTALKNWSEYIRGMISKSPYCRCREVLENAAFFMLSDYKVLKPDRH